jgi:diguanylate cyclase (GGDEF)-like protein
MPDPVQGGILIVDDTPNNLRFLSTTLTEHGYKVRSVTSGQMALTVAQAAQPELILLDIKMPNMDGYEVCQRLKSSSRTQEIPVIFLSALDEVIDKVKAFNVGGVDYITKPFQLEEVLARIENQLDLRRAKAEVQTLNAELEHRVRQRTIQLEHEIAERQRAQDKLLHLALHDSLTGLPNRTWFMKRAGQVLDRARQHGSYLFAVLLLDCDRFKVVNDSLGHLAGDQLLVAVARRIETCLTPGTTLARLGGDEFTILIDDVANLEDAISVAERIQQDLRMPFQLGQYETFTNVSIGIVLGGKQYDQPEHLLRDADAAMYQAKGEGKAGYRVFDSSLHKRAMARLELETDLQRALDRQEFVVHYQPIVSLHDGSLSGFEALVRWHHPRLGMIPPGQFVPVAEETGLVVPIDLWVMRQACHQLRHWQEHWERSHPITMAVNLSVQHFIHADLMAEIDDILTETGLSGRSLRIEITESAIMKNAEFATVILEQLKARQIQFSIDDFGTGYSSLSYLHQFPVDGLKIDRSFVSNIQARDQNLKIVQTIIALADTLNMSAIAEGIETYQQLALLQSLGCEYGQGFYFSQPLPADEAAALFQAPQPWPLSS